MPTPWLVVSALPCALVACGQIGDPPAGIPAEDGEDTWTVDAGPGPTTGDPGDAGPAGSPGAEGGGDACDGGVAATVDFVNDVAPILRARCTGCHDGSDDDGLDLRSHAATLRGGRSGAAVAPGECASSILWLKTGPEPPFGLRMPADGPPWLTDGERATLCAWIDGGAIERAQVAAPCASADAGTVGSVDGPEDVTPPAFDGCDSVDEFETRCVLAWEPAVDDTTPSAEIVYEVYVAPEESAFADTPAIVTTPGATGATLDGLAAGDWRVRVRAVDTAGNRDANDRTRECSLR